MESKSAPPSSHGKPLDKAAPAKSLTYASYLKVAELLKLQEPLSQPVAHDELLFIVIHQTYELWFKQILFETEAVVQHLLQDKMVPALRGLNRVGEILHVLIQQVDILETMTPVEFNRFRSHLNPASGFQSAQFRELEMLLGMDASQYVRFFDLEPEWKDRLQNRMRNLTVRNAFLQLLSRRNLLPTRDEKDLKPALLKIYSDPDHQDLYNLCEQMIGLDEQVLLWRFRHVQMVERMIGMKKGTGGSLGVSYLQTTLQKRFFPELWEIRTEMDNGATY